MSGESDNDDDAVAALEDWNQQYDEMVVTPEVNFYLFII